MWIDTTKHVVMYLCIYLFRALTLLIPFKTRYFYFEDILFPVFPLAELILFDACASDDAELRERLFQSDVEPSTESPWKVDAVNGDADVKTQSGSLFCSSEKKKP